MKIVLIISIILILNCNLISAFFSRGCSTVTLQSKYEKSYPCSWNKQLLATYKNDVASSPVFKCRNVPPTASLSYNIEVNNQNAQIPYSVSVWALDDLYQLDVTDQIIYNNYQQWTALSPTEKTTSNITCVNNPDCLSLLSENKVSSLTNIGVNSNITQITTYNLYIFNGNNASYIHSSTNSGDFTPYCLDLYININFS